MATRANEDLSLALQKAYTVKSGVTLSIGSRVKFGTTDQEVDLAGANDDTSIGTVTGLPNAPGRTNQPPAFVNDSNAPTSVLGDGTSKYQVTVALDSNLIVRMRVGTGGSTRGVKQIAVADGLTDAPTNGGGTTPHTIVGIAMQSGVLGDFIGCMPTPGRSVAAT